MTNGLAAGATFHQEVAADIANVTEMRRRLARWTGSHDIPGGRTDDIMIAAYEAMANAALHAYPDGEVGTMAVTAQVDGQVLTLTITDDGRWRHRPARLGGGLGLALMRATADATIVDSGPRGTTVRLRWEWS